MRERMRLKLKYKPGPATAPQFAEDIVAAAEEISGVQLDFSEESLEDVDGILQSMLDDGVGVGEIKETLFGFGCYVGEVFVRNAGGAWKELVQNDLGWPLVIALPDGSLCNPIDKVFKRLELGEGESLPYFYRVFAKGRAEPR